MAVVTQEKSSPFGSVFVETRDVAFDDRVYQENGDGDGDDDDDDDDDVAPAA